MGWDRERGRGEGGGGGGGEGGPLSHGEYSEKIMDPLYELCTREVNESIPRRLFQCHPSPPTLTL